MTKALLGHPRAARGDVASLARVGVARSEGFSDGSSGVTRATGGYAAYPWRGSFPPAATIIRLVVLRRACPLGCPQGCLRGYLRVGQGRGIEGCSIPALPPLRKFQPYRGAERCMLCLLGLEEIGERLAATAPPKRGYTIAAISRPVIHVQIGPPIRVTHRCRVAARTARR